MNIAMVLSLGLGGCSSSKKEDNSLSDIPVRYAADATTPDATSIDLPADNGDSSKDSFSHPQNYLCPDGSSPKTYLKDEDKDSYYAKGVVACQPPSDGIKYFLKEDVIPPGTIPFFDCYDKSGVIGATIYPGAAELCDGLDNNCDGNTDEDIIPKTKSCDTACGKGYQYKDCVDGSWPTTWSTCSAGIPGGEVCNNYDDDCDGVVDNNLLDTPSSCETYCGKGVSQCVAGGWTCTPIPSSDCCETIGEVKEKEVCDQPARVFALDFSGSTNVSTPLVQQKLTDYATVEEKAGHELKMGLVAFTDVVLSPSGWPTTYEEFKSWLGGYVNQSSPEGHLDALVAAIALDWPEAQEKYLILCGNSHFADQSMTYTISDVQEMAAAKNITLIAFELFEDAMFFASPDYAALAGVENSYYAKSASEIPAILDTILSQDVYYKGMVCSENHQWVTFDECVDTAK